MRFSNDGSNWWSWQIYGTSVGWFLNSGDGSKSVYAQFKDTAGNASSIVSATITLDTTGPSGSMVINNGATYAASSSVNLTLNATDNLSGVAQMAFSNDGTLWSGWETYSLTKTWTLSPGDGFKSVYALFRDGAGNQSPSPAVSQITLDTAAPTGSISINSGDPYTNAETVNLGVDAFDTGSGQLQMSFSNDGSSWSPWETYSNSKVWMLVSGNGSRTVYARFRDAAGNISANASASIVLDTLAPTGSILINSGAAFVVSSTVTLNLTAQDNLSNVARMAFSNDGNAWFAWEPFSTSKAWTLEPGEGTHIVFARFRDGATNTSTVVSDTIILDTQTPTAGVTPLTPYQGSLSFLVAWSGLDATSGIANYDVQYRDGAGGTVTG
jgi:hypothetical protein